MTGTSVTLGTAWFVCESALRTAFEMAAAARHTSSAAWPTVTALPAGTIRSCSSGPPLIL